MSLLEKNITLAITSIYNCSYLALLKTIFTLSLEREHMLGATLCLCSSKGQFLDNEHSSSKEASRVGNRKLLKTEKETLKI